MDPDATLKRLIPPRFTENGPNDKDVPDAGRLKDVHRELRNRGAVF